MALTTRLATRNDLAALDALAKTAIDENQRAFLTDEQVTASHAIMGIDTQLIDDGT